VSYRAPVNEIAFTLKHVAGLKAGIDAGAFGDLGEDLVDAILEEAGRFATDEITPLRAVGDEVGAVWKDRAVTTPPAGRISTDAGSRAAGTPSRDPRNIGGQGLPMMLGVAALEMWNSGSMAFALGPT
jgi:acyl-CoA dehydrogenase